VDLPDELSKRDASGSLIDGNVSALGEHLA
jgi:hypothetical protein